MLLSFAIGQKEMRKVHLPLAPRGSWSVPTGYSKDWSQWLPRRAADRLGPFHSNPPTAVGQGSR